MQWRAVVGLKKAETFSALVLRAGKGRVFQCLQQSLAQPDFGQACRAQVEERGQRMQVRFLFAYPQQPLHANLHCAFLRPSVQCRQAARRDPSLSYFVQVVICQSASHAVV